MSKPKKVNLKKTLLTYKNASPLLRQAMLLDTIVELAQAVEGKRELSEDRMNALRQLVRYANILHQVENQQPFVIAPEFCGMPLAEPLNRYIAFEKPNKMILKKPLNEIPMGVWHLFQKAQRDHLEYTVPEAERAERLKRFVKETVKIRHPITKHLDVVPAQLGIEYTKTSSTDLEGKTKANEVLSQIIEDAQKVMFDPDKLWEEGYNFLLKATSTLSPKKQAKILSAVQILKAEAAKIHPSDIEKKELLYKQFSKHCKKNMEGSNPTILKSILTAISVLLGTALGAAMGFGAGIVLGSWSGPGAFAAGLAGGGIMAAGVIAGAGIQGIQTGGFVGYKLFSHRAVAKAGVKGFVGGLRIIDALEESKFAGREVGKKKSTLKEEGSTRLNNPFK